MQATVLNLYGWWRIVFRDAKKIPFAPEKVTLLVEILKGALARLRSKFLLLPLDPIKFQNGEQANRVDTHAFRSSDAYSTRRRMHAKVDVLDVFESNVNAQVAQ